MHPQLSSYHILFYVISHHAAFSRLDSQTFEDSTIVAKIRLTVTDIFISGIEQKISRLKARPADTALCRHRREDRHQLGPQRR